MDLTTPDGVGTTIPLVVANMTAISGRRMAETVARRGGLAVLPQDIPLDVVAEVVALGQDAPPGLRHRDHAGPTSTVGEALSLLTKRAHGVVVVVDGGAPVGLVTEGDCQGVDRFAQLSEVMVADPLTVPAGTDLREDLRRPLRRAGRGRAGGRGRPAGRRDHPQGRAALGDLHAGGRRGRAAADLGRGRASTATSPARPRALLGAGVDVLVVDTAHGHQEKAVEAVRAVRSVRRVACRSWPATW